MAAQLQITFDNNSGVDFTLGANGGYLAPACTWVMKPDTVLRGMDTQDIGVNNVGTFGEGRAKFCCCWYEPSSRAVFGIQIDASAIILKMGWSPVWNVGSGIYAPGADLAAEPVWQASGGDPANPYFFPETLGYKIHVRPQVGDETLMIAASIFKLEQ